MPIRVAILRRSRFNVGTKSHGGATGNYAAGVFGPGLRSVDRWRDRSRITDLRRKGGDFDRGDMVDHPLIPARGLECMRRLSLARNLPGMSVEV